MSDEFGTVIFHRDRDGVITGEHTGPDLVLASGNILDDFKVEKTKGNKFEIGGLRFEIVDLKTQIGSFETWIVKVLV